MSTFSAPVPAATSPQLVMPSAIVPSDARLRMSGERIRWIGLPAGTVISAFATGAIARADAPTGGIPGQPSAAWTAFELSPLPQLDFAAFKRIPGGLPIQIVLVVGGASLTPGANDVLDCGTPLVTAPPGAGSTAFLGFAFQDRICRDVLTAAETIAASNACSASWATYVAALAAAPSARNLMALDHRGAPLSGLSIKVNGGAPIVLTSAMDGDTGVSVSAASSATIAVPDLTESILASVTLGDEPDAGNFKGPLTLFPGRRLVQVLNAPDWMAEPDDGVSLTRWSADSHVEPLQDGTRYFTRLVEDMRTTKNGGAVQVAGWAVVKGSLTDSSVDWPLIPGDKSTTFLALVQELHGGNAKVRILLNQFLQLDSATFDDGPELAPILFALFVSLAPLQGLAGLNTDPAGYLVGWIGVAALIAILSNPVTMTLIKKVAETSQPMKDALDLIDATIATWTPYPAAFSDNPLVAPAPFKVLAHTIDDISHIGVYHQKFVIIQPPGKQPHAFMGGIDLNNDRPDTPLHRVRHPFHDLQVRLTGPAVESIVKTYAERAKVHGGIVEIQPAAVDPAPESPHLVQIARTYYKPASSPGPFHDFAPNGESTPTRTILSAIRQARDFIMIEDQYFTPSDEYMKELLAAAGPDRGVRALMITTNFASDQPYGQVRRAQVVHALQTAWGPRLHIGALARRFAHEVPALTTNLGRFALTEDLAAGAAMASIGPPGRMPAPPFWAFIGNEMVLIHAIVGAATPTAQKVEISRSAPVVGWGAQPVKHQKGAPVLAVQVPGIYVHAKMMIVDDIFLFAGSTNVNRRSHYHDGELNSFTIPQHLLGDSQNPARLMRSRLMAEHLGLTSEIGQALFADPHSAFKYFSDRSWYEQSRWRPLDFFGSLPADVPIGTAGSIPMFLLQILLGAARDGAKPDVWPLLADPTSGLDPHSSSKGPDYP
jgi:phosphatidylserine/phosphatidylglycerophosphate/cardiolipin synthase-like enzyme